MPVGDGKLGFTAMAYDGKWNSTDQVAKRAVDEGLIGRYGSLDASDGGTSSRYSFSVDYSAPLADGQFTTTAYWFKYRLNLFSNFTYFLDDPVNGDQFEQADDRNVIGWTGSWTKSAELFGVPTRNTLGFELRQDRIRPVGLYSTRERERLSITREDNVTEGSAGVYAQNDTQWNDWFRSILGIRYDWYRFNVDSIVPENSGNVTSGMASPKASLVFGPWDKTEYFVNAGYGFHSNDARGVTIRVDPKTGDPVDPATPLVRSKGAELGIRTGAIPNVQSSLALWYLKLDSELVFVGDAGTTEAGRPSQRYGVEWNTRWRPLPWMFVDLDLAWNRARFSDGAPEGDYIPGAPDSVALGGGCRRPLRTVVGRRVPALHRRVPADRGQQRSLRRVHGGGCAGRLRDRAKDEAAARRVQRVQRQDQRHHVLLRLPAARRAAGRRERHPLPPGREAQLSRHALVHVLSSVPRVQFGGFSPTAT